jgi:hypothetical protein
VGQAFDSHPWDRLPDEPEIWHKRFKEFFLPQTPDYVNGRSLIAAYRGYRGSRLGPTGKRLKPPGRWARQALKFKWRERSLDGDLHEMERTTQAEMKRIAYELDRDQTLRKLWDQQPELHGRFTFERFAKMAILMDEIKREYAVHGVTLSQEQMLCEIQARKAAGTA